MSRQNHDVSLVLEEGSQHAAPPRSLGTRSPTGDVGRVHLQDVAWGQSTSSPPLVPQGERTELRFSQTLASGVLDATYMPPMGALA